MSSQRDKTIRDQFCEKAARESRLDVPTLLKIDEQFRAGLTLEEFLKCIGEFKAALEEAPRRLEGTWHTVLGALNVLPKSRHQLRPANLGERPGSIMKD